MVHRAAPSMSFGDECRQDGFSYALAIGVQAIGLDSCHPMIRALMSSFQPKKGHLPGPAMPEGSRIYAVGDIHGRADLLDRLLEMIGRDCSVRSESKVTLIFLGDYINRGAESAKVITRLAALMDSPVHARFLMGNHEEILLRLLDGDDDLWSFFLRMGGDATLASYGLGIATVEGDPRGVVPALKDAIPSRHVAFLESLEDMIVIGDYAFVHAGVQPALSLDRQSPSALRWIRGEFLDHEQPLEKIIVHGHTISEDVVETPARIGIDTGAYMSNRLTAVAFEDKRRWIIQAESSET